VNVVRLTLHRQIMVVKHRVKSDRLNQCLYETSENIEEAMN